MFLFSPLAKKETVWSDLSQQRHEHLYIIFQEIWISKGASVRGVCWGPLDSCDSDTLLNVRWINERESWLGSPFHTPLSGCARSIPAVNKQQLPSAQPHSYIWKWLTDCLFSSRSDHVSLRCSGQYRQSLCHWAAQSQGASAVSLLFFYQLTLKTTKKKLCTVNIWHQN